MTGADFTPTHSILFNPDHPTKNRREFFMFIPDECGNGPLFSSDEWENAETADWEIVNGEFLFQGQSSPGSHEVEVLVANNA